MKVPPLSPMRNPIRDYDWGSTSALAQLQNRIPSGDPEAELWMGAHPGAPSSLVMPAAAATGGVLPLPDAIAEDPETVLGASGLARFGARLPYLMKILAIAKPLSLQVHPDAARAAERYRADGDGLYADRWHKPEMLYALAPTEALLGFRPVAQVLSLLERLGCERLADLQASLGKDDDSDDTARLRRAFATLLRWPPDQRMSLVADVASALIRLETNGNTGYPDVFGWMGRLVGLYPADPMVLAPALLDLVKLAPGDSFFVPPGVPHCYLCGLGLEIMAASDNVLRAGLTSKAVEVDELLTVADTRPLAAPEAAISQLGPAETNWRVPVEEFQLSRIRIAAGDAVMASETISGPQILLCTAGLARVTCGSSAVELPPGASAFATAQAGQLELSAAGPEPAEVFRAAAG